MQFLLSFFLCLALSLQLNLSLSFGLGLSLRLLLRFQMSFLLSLLLLLKCLLRMLLIRRLLGLGLIRRGLVRRLLILRMELRQLLSLRLVRRCLLSLLKRRLVELMRGLAGPEHWRRGRGSGRLRIGKRMGALALLLQMLLLEPLERLLRGRDTHGVRMGRHGRLRIHGMGAIIGHGVHVPLKTLQGQVGILQLADRVGIPGQQIGRALRGEMPREGVEMSRRIEADKRTG